MDSATVNAWEWHNYLLVQEFYRSGCGLSSSIGVEVSRSRKSKFDRSFLPAQVRMWNDLPYTVFDTGMLDWFKGAVNCWLLS